MANLERIALNKEIQLLDEDQVQTMEEDLEDLVAVVHPFNNQEQGLSSGQCNLHSVDLLPKDHLSYQVRDHPHLNNLHHLPGNNHVEDDLQQHLHQLLIMKILNFLTMMLTLL